MESGSICLSGLATLAGFIGAVACVRASFPAGVSETPLSARAVLRFPAVCGRSSCCCCRGPGVQTSSRLSARWLGDHTRRWTCWSGRASSCECEAPPRCLLGAARSPLLPQRGGYRPHTLAWGPLSKGYLRFCSKRKQNSLYLESRTQSWTELWTWSSMPRIYANDIPTGKPGPQKEAPQGSPSPKRIP